MIQRTHTVYAFIRVLRCNPKDYVLSSVIELKNHKVRLLRKVAEAIRLHRCTFCDTK